MIYNDEFVWIHIPKCAGTKTENLFRRYFPKTPRLHQDVVNINLDPLIVWHDSINEREQRDNSFVLGNRTIICPFRLLPNWLESRYNFEFYRNPQLNHRPDLLLEGRFLNWNGKEGYADNIVKRYLPPRILDSGRLVFVRTENFEEDFKSAFGRFVDITVIPVDEFAIKENTSANALPESIRRQLNTDSALLYEKCPNWRRVEELVYGRPSINERLKVTHGAVR